MEEVIWAWLQAIPLFWIHLSASCAMLGIIWFVQVVHYPLYHAVSEDSYRTYHQGHMTRTSFIIAPLMLVELLSGVGILMFPDQLSSPQFFVYSMWLLGGIWISTFLIQVPFHRKLDSGKNIPAIKGLILSNWIRTFLWSVRIPLLVMAVAGG